MAITAVVTARVMGSLGPAPRIDPPVAIDNPDAALESQDRVYRLWSCIAVHLGQPDGRSDMPVQ